MERGEVSHYKYSHNGLYTNSQNFQHQQSVNRKRMLCANCGKPGHEFKYCNEPITSFGIINIKVDDGIIGLSGLNSPGETDIPVETQECFLIKDKFSTTKSTYYKVMSKKYPNVKCYISDNIKLYENHNDNYKMETEVIAYDSDEQFQKFCYYRDKIKFLMVSRRFSLGFIEFIRGKYDPSDSKGIINLFEQMTTDEIKYLSSNDYDTILYHFLNRTDENKEVVLNKIYEGKYSAEYCESKVKFNLLMNSEEDVDNNIPWNMNFYTKYIKPKWTKPEWGFPKGRRDKKAEENLTCACREFEEETGYKKDEYTVLNKIEPIEEKLIGTNGVNYKHVYYLAMTSDVKNTALSQLDYYEIGDVKWLTYDEAMMHIRPYHVDKRKILTRVYLFILNHLIHYDNQFELF